VPFADDHLRREIERIPPADYLNASYYELWYKSITSILRERNVIAPDDFDTPKTLKLHPLCQAAIRPEAVAAAVFAGASTRAGQAVIPQTLAVGDKVRVLNNHPLHHTRVPQYIRGRTGRVIADHGVFNFPDTNSQDRGDCPQHCYTVEFESTEIWGDQADKTVTVTVDLWESYMQRVSNN
jgi:nitrile hydratase